MVSGRGRKAVLPGLSFSTTMRIVHSRLDRDQGAPGDTAKPKVGVGSGLLGLAGLLIVVGILGFGWITWSDPPGTQGRTGGSPLLSQFLPFLFPSATPLPTSTPTTEERIAVLLTEADRAWQGMELGKAIVALESARALQPDEQQIRDRLFVAHSTLGLRLADEGRLQEAISHFDAALAMRPDDPLAREGRDIAASYLQALDNFDQGDLGTAILHLEKLYMARPSYQQARVLLYQAHYTRGLALQEQGLLQEAKTEYERALEVSPGQQLAAARLQEVIYLLTPPTPTLTPTPTVTPTSTPRPVPPKSIVVDVSSQLLWAYEGDVLKWEFVCSTGRPGSNTRRGTFQVLDKIPNAWGGRWGIWMPYWLGIYWAGGSENGIHALPINPDGSTLWAGYLGTPISFGCIVLDTWAARLLYEWADLGTPVMIQN